MYHAMYKCHMYDWQDLSERYTSWRQLHPVSTGDSTQDVTTAFCASAPLTPAAQKLVGTSGLTSDGSVVYEKSVQVLPNKTKSLSSMRVSGSVRCVILGKRKYWSVYDKFDDRYQSKYSLLQGVRL